MHCLLLLLTCILSFFWQCIHNGKTLLIPFDSFLGLARTIYIRCVYGIFGREIIKYTVMYGAYTRFWPTLFFFLFCGYSIPGGSFSLYKTWIFDPFYSFSFSVVTRYQVAPFPCMKRGEWIFTACAVLPFLLWHNAPEPAVTQH